MMNQSEAEKQITKILAQLEQDQGVVVRIGITRKQDQYISVRWWRGA